MTTAQNPIEIAFHTPGKGWKRRTFASEAAMQRFIDTLDEDVEVRVAG